jgi:DJ-1 family protein
MKAVVLMAEGFEEMELSISTDILRRAGIEVGIATLKNEITPITGSRGIKMLPDLIINDIDSDTTDLLILPGGTEGAKNLGGNDKVIELLKLMNSKQKLLAAICAAPAVIVKAGIAAGKTLTSHPAAKDHMVGVNYSEERVVKDGNIITSRAAGTTFEFAFALVSELLGRQAAQEVNNGVLARI